MTADAVAKAKKAAVGARDHGRASSVLVATGSGGGRFAFDQMTVGFVFSPLKRHEAAYGTDVLRDVPLAPASGWLLPAGLSGACEWSGDSLFLNVSFSADLVGEITGGRNEGFAPRYGFADATAVNIALDLHAHGGEGPIATVYREAMTLALAAHLLKATEGSEPPVVQAPVLADQRLARAIDRIEADLTADLSLEELAGIAGMSTFHFARSFKAATGEAPHRFLIRRRVERAKILLRTTPLPVAEIAFRVGWENVSHFSQAFKSVTGLTPGAFRAG
jgi:AraC family transcriptional regulator